MAELSDRLRGSVTVDAVAEYLNGLGPSERVGALSRLGRDDQRRLFEIASASEPLDLEFFVPAAAQLGSVRHRGTNTLPLPRRLRQFEKRFARSPDAEELYGYNEWALRRLIGPGYFVARSTGDHPGWRERGGVVVDYFEVPDSEVPREWPEVVPNTEGLQRFVFRGTRDFMRRVSDDVSIGAAFRGEKALDHYFTLCRV